MAALLAGVVPAQAATPTITVSATSSNPLVTGDVWAIYQNGKWGTARIHRAITGAAAGEVATLYAQQFPYTTAAKPVRSITPTVTGTFTVGNNSAYWDWTLCAKDTESRNGLGLPGSHGCGASRVLQTANYYLG